MKTKALRLYGELDLRLEEFELPAMKPGEILIRIITDSVCMSTYKTAKQGAKHLRVPDNVAEHPAIVGHELCAEIVDVGERWTGAYTPGEKVVIPPVLDYLGGYETIGYTFGEIGGDSTYSLVYEHIIENGFLMKLDSDAYFSGSLIEPYSCVLRGFKASLHTDTEQNYLGGIREGGRMAILAGCGPMGLAAVDLALHGEKRPSLLVVTDINEARLQRAMTFFNAEDALKDGIRLIFTTASDKDSLLSLADGEGFDDVFIYAPNTAVTELGDSILAFDGCLNFFSGPMDKGFSAKLNFYQVHYARHHVAGSSGSTLSDMKDIVSLIEARRINPAVMVTHIGGLDAARDTTLRLPEIPGGKKLIYTQLSMPLTAIEDFGELGKTDPRFAKLCGLTEAHNGLWSPEAENYLLSWAEDENGETAIQ